jgi:hypothetical protein
MKRKRFHAVQLESQVWRHGCVRHQEAACPGRRERLKRPIPYRSTNLGFQQPRPHLGSERNLFENPVCQHRQVWARHCCRTCTCRGSYVL